MKTAVQAKFDAQKIAFAPVIFQAVRALRNLGILETIEQSKEAGISVEEIADKTGMSPYGVEVLLDMGVNAEVVERSPQGNFMLTKTGFFIQYDDLTRVNMDFVHDVCYQGLFSLESSIRQGKPEGLKVFGTHWKTVYEALSQLPAEAQDSWFAFDHFYSDQAFPEVLPLIFGNDHAPRKLLDVGGNTGKWAMQCARYSPQVEVVILDLPGQLAKAQENIERHGLIGRISGYPIDLLETNGREFPKGADAIWMSQFLVCFSKAEILSILQKAARAMEAHTSLYILDTYWDTQRFEASEYSLNATSLYFTCIANGNSRVYRAQDLKSLLDEAGLYVEHEWNDIGISHALWKCRKK